MNIVTLLLVSFLLYAQTALANKAEFGINEIHAIVKNKNVKTLDDFLARLPKFFFEPQHFTMAFKANGLLKSSFTKPNAYLFGDARSSVVIVFNTSAKRGGSETVEVRSLNPLLNSHSLSEITFVRGKKTRIEKNPTACIQCHGTQSKPLWRSVYKWDGFFGSYNDLFTTSSDQPTGVQEKAAWLELTKSTSSRLKLFDMSRKLSELDEKRYPRYAPNLFFGVKLAAEHARVIAGKIFQHPEYAAAKWKVIQALSLCSPNTIPVMLNQFNIPSEYFYMNRENAPDKGLQPDQAISGSAFHTGLAPFEYIIISKLIEMDPSIIESGIFKQFIYRGLAKGEIEELGRQMSYGFPEKIVAPDYVKGEFPRHLDSEFCRELHKQL